MTIALRYNHFSQPFKWSRFVFLTINLVMHCEQQRPKQNNRENPAFKTKYRAANIYLFSKHLPNVLCAWYWKKLGWNSKICGIPWSQCQFRKRGRPRCLCMPKEETQHLNTECWVSQPWGANALWEHSGGNQLFCLQDGAGHQRGGDTGLDSLRISRGSLEERDLSRMESKVA